MFKECDNSVDMKMRGDLMKLIFSMLPPLILMLAFYVSYSKRNDVLGFAMMQALLLGILIVYPVSLFEQQAIPMNMVMDLKGILYSNFIVVGGIEEMAKLLLAYYIIKYGSPLLKEPISVVLLTVAAATGFALIENIIYVHDGGHLTAGLRAISSIPMHASTAVVIGFFGSREVMGTDPFGWIKGFFLAVLMHGTYNSYAVYFNSSEWFIGVFVIAMSYLLISGRMLGHLKRKREQESIEESGGDENDE